MRDTITHVAPATIIMHANWTEGMLALWAETSAASVAPAGDRAHPFSVAPDQLAHVLQVQDGLRRSTIHLRLPTQCGVPQASPHLAHAIGRAAHGAADSSGDVMSRDPHAQPDSESQAGAGGLQTVEAIEIATWSVGVLLIEPSDSLDWLEAIEAISASTEEHLVDESAAHESEAPLHLVASASVHYFAQVGRFAASLLAQQRVVPVLLQHDGGALEARWRPWLADKASAAPFHELVDAMPPAARAVADAFEHEPTAIVESLLGDVIDAHVRESLRRDQMVEALEDWDGEVDPQVAWLDGLLDGRAEVRAVEERPGEMARTVRRWVARLEDRGPGGEWRLLLRLDDPIVTGDLGDLEAPSDDLIWLLTFHLQSVENPLLVIDAEDVWTLRSESASVAGRRVESPRELLLKELGRASRVHPELARALEDPAPVEMELTTSQAYEFLREVRPVLEEQGISISAPAWWDEPSARIGARLVLDPPDELPGAESSSGPSSSGPTRLGLETLVGYRWNIAVGQRTLSLEEFEKLAELKAPLVRVDGQWVEVRRDDVRSALEFIRGAPGGEMRVGEALRMALASDLHATGVPILGIEAEGWVDRLLNAEEGARMPIVEPPVGFEGTLRPYQVRGLSWMTYLDQIGLGACLADDMGLGKTIQLLALLLHERKLASEAGEGGLINPTLIVVPMSIVGNWKREANRFAPSLNVLIHHGLDRLTGASFRRSAEKADLVVTTYALAHRDRELLELIEWGRVVLDEAQNIKNPSAKQTQAIKSFSTPRRVVLTGTPLENRLTELWSIMEFCNPGLLGTLGDFRRRFAVPVERRKNRHRSAQLRSLVRPFILRRLKTDPTVISDLPPKVETKEYCTLTPEQVSLYESCVGDLLQQVESSDGIRRRGIVLTSLVRLKQICDHPALLPAGQNGSGSAPIASRSGKCIRLIEMLDEVLASEEQALVFTQFRQMGELLASMLRQAFDREILLFHGGTSAGQRERIVDAFQKGDGSNPVLVLSLKAGGVGLNLTAASHVFHFDRWWNPAVENQATDRAFRIGQTKRVNVHKFIVSGTLEDRINQMIESKIALAEDIIGSGEDWLTELNSAQLKEILTLRPEAFGDAP